MTSVDPDAGPVPEDNLPGHHPDHDQDRPDLDAVAAKLGTVPPGDREEAAGPSAAERVEALLVTSISIGSGLVLGAAAVGRAVARSAGRQAFRRLGLSR